MRTNIALITISLILLAVCTVCVVTMHQTITDMGALIRQALYALETDAAAAQTALHEFARLWALKETRWQLFAIHTDLEEVSFALTDAQNAMRSGNTTEARTACEHLLIVLESILRKEMPSLGNIF